jgi:hypothetical protein
LIFLCILSITNRETKKRKKTKTRNIKEENEKWRRKVGHPLGSP